MPSQRKGLKKSTLRSGVITKKNVCRSVTISRKRSYRSVTITKVEDNSNNTTRRLRSHRALKGPDTLSTSSGSQSNSAPKLKLGFILGEKIFGYHIVNNLLNCGHKLIVCLLGFSEEVESKFLIMGAEIVSSPLEVWREADMIISYLPKAEHTKALIFGEYSVLKELNSTKYFIEMTCIDADTSNEIDNTMKSHGVKYLEAQIQGSIKEAISGYLVILTAGDQNLFKMCQSCFEAIGFQSFFFGDIGAACKINLTVQMIKSVFIAGLAQGLSLAKQYGFRIDDVLEVMRMTSISSTLIRDKGICMSKEQYPPEMSLNQMQQILVSVQKMAEEVQHPIPITTTVHEKFKECILLGLGTKDVSAVFQSF